MGGCIVVAAQCRVRYLELTGLVLRLDSSPTTVHHRDKLQVGLHHDEPEEQHRGASSSRGASVRPIA
jgi:hypothetical protein